MGKGREMKQGYTKHVMAAIPQTHAREEAAGPAGMVGLRGNGDTSPSITLPLHSTSVKMNLTAMPDSLNLAAVDRSCLTMPTAQALGSLGQVQFLSSQYQRQILKRNLY